MYQKIRFCTQRGICTSAIVVDRPFTISEAKRLFPMFEANKTDRFESSPAFDSWDEAFYFDFDEA